MLWRKDTPMVYISLIWALGIWFAESTGLSVLWLLMACLLAAFAIHWIKFRNPKFQIQHYTWILVLLMLSFFNTKSKDPDHLQKMLIDHVQENIEYTMLLTVKECAVSNNGSVKMTSKMEYITDEKEFSFQPGCDVLVHWRPTGTKITMMKFGTQIKLKAKLRKIPGPRQEYEFDYRNFLRRKGILFQIFCSEKNIVVLNQDGSFMVQKLLINYREKCLEWLSRYVDDSDSRGILAAMTLGQKQYLSDEIKKTYAHSGAMHVLAVSGLHAGIIAGILLWLLGDKHNHIMAYRLLRSAIAILGLWAFVLISGMSPSVVRAAIMFTLILLGKLLFRKQASIMNTVALSAFIMLLWDPLLLYNLSFQLSYSALIGIIIFQEKIFKSIYFRHAYFQKIWSLISLSLAAQIGTLPFTISYFNYLPTYAWLSGILVVPLAALLLSLTIGLYVGSMLLGDILGLPLGNLLNWITLCQNYLLRQTKILPFNKIENLWITDLEAALLAIGILLIGYFLHSSYIKYLRWGLWFFLALGLSINLRSFKALNQTKTIVYQDKDFKMVDLYFGKQCICISRNKSLDTWMEQTVHKTRLAHFIGSCKKIELPNLHHSPRTEISLRLP